MLLIHFAFSGISLCIFLVSENSCLQAWATAYLAVSTVDERWKGPRRGGQHSSLGWHRKGAGVRAMWRAQNHRNARPLASQQKIGWVGGPRRAPPAQAERVVASQPRHHCSAAVTSPAIARLVDRVAQQLASSPSPLLFWLVATPLAPRLSIGASATRLQLAWPEPLRTPVEPSASYQCTLRLARVRARAPTHVVEFR
jgi:hypothetical protein